MPPPLATPTISAPGSISRRDTAPGSRGDLLPLPPLLLLPRLRVRARLAALPARLGLLRLRKRVPRGQPVLLRPLLLDGDTAPPDAVAAVAAAPSSLRPPPRRDVDAADDGPVVRVAASPPLLALLLRDGDERMSGR